MECLTPIITGHILSDSVESGRLDCVDDYPECEAVKRLLVRNEVRPRSAGS